MIVFEKDVASLLPYDRESYFGFLDEEPNLDKWCGISCQLDHEVSIGEYIVFYESLFKSVVSELDTGALWIVNHDDYDAKWFPNNEKNLPMLRKLFKINKIPNKFRGAIIFSTQELIEYYRDIVSYPCSVFDEEGALYKYLDISHNEKKFIIKISSHLNIDFITPDSEILKKIMERYTQGFIVKKYRSSPC